MATASNTLKPSDFICPPFKRCPRCGEDTYGIWMIGPDSYSRKCKQCDHPVGGAAGPFPLPALNKKVLYLDQLVLSEMLKASNAETKAYKSGKADPFWRTVYVKLSRLCRAQLIVCPESEFHWDESLVSPFPRALKETYESLSQGLSFYDRDSIQLFQLMDSAEHWLHGTAVEIKALDPQLIINEQINAWPPLRSVSLNLNFGEDVRRAIRQGLENKNRALNESVFPKWRLERDKSFEAKFAEEMGGFRKALLKTAGQC